MAAGAEGHGMNRIQVFNTKNTMYLYINQGMRKCLTHSCGCKGNIHVLPDHPRGHLLSRHCKMRPPCLPAPNCSALPSTCVTHNRCSLYCLHDTTGRRANHWIIVLTEMSLDLGFGSYSLRHRLARSTMIWKMFNFKI